MTKQSATPQNPHIWPYTVACILVLVIPIVGVVAYVFIAGFATRPHHDNAFLVMLAMAPLWWALDYVLAAPRTHRVLPLLSSSEVQERVSRALFFGAFGSLFFLEGVSGVWAIVSQYVGGVVIIFCGVTAFDWAFERLWAGLKRMWTNT